MHLFYTYYTIILTLIFKKKNIIFQTQKCTGKQNKIHPIPFKYGVHYDGVSRDIPQIPRI